MAIIYKHTCLTSGKCYIGQTVKSMKRRWQEHCADAKYNTSRKFMLALKKYGTEDWNHEVLFESSDSSIINDKEIEYIKLFNSVKNGYNTSCEKFRTNTLHRDDSIEKMRTSQKAAHARRKEEGTDSWTRKDGGAMLGKQHPGKGKSNANKGKKAGQTWEEIFGVEGAAKRREEHARRRLQRKQEVR